MSALRALLVALPFAAGCLEIGKTTYRFDLGANTGTLVLADVRTDTPADAEKDFAELVNSYVLGNKVSEDHPTWNVGERRLYEDAGALSGEVRFTFSRASDVGLYQYDKKSPYLWCAADTETVISTSGEIVGLYPKCVVFDRKTRVFEITVQTGASTGSGTSLLPQFRTWDGKEVAVADGAGALGDMMGLLGALGNLAQNGGPTEIGESWAALNLPTEGGTVVLSTEQMLEVSFPGAEAGATADRWQQALVAGGWKLTGEEAGARRFSKGEESLRLSAVKAGPSVLVVLSR